MAIKVDGICEYCYRAFVYDENGLRPTGWDVVFGCYVCPEHMKTVIEAGKAGVVPGGCFAYSDDPRSRPNAIIKDP